jgi:cyclin B
MRHILVDFIIEVHCRFGLVPGTLYLAINILDRYLSSEGDARRVTRTNLQLVGIVALLISSKFEEVWALSSTDCVCICENASYDERDVVDMETSILGALNYEINVPCAHAFLVRYLRAVNATTEVVNLSNYVLDGTLQSYYLLSFLPSQLAAASVFISRKTVGEDAWCTTLLKNSRYREEEVLSVARAVVAVKTYCSAGLFAVKRKYGRGEDGGGVSNVELCSDF